MTAHRFSPLAFTFCLLFAPPALAHAEHDKPRYVAEHGEDRGRCDKISAPCKTIGYAAQQAGKGDNILVAAGSYEISDIPTLFYLISNVVPVKGGFSPKQFKAGADQITRLIGVPPDYADELAAKGFTVLADRKGLDEKSNQQLSQKLSVLDAMGKPQTQLPCVDGKAGAFPCHNIDLVAHLPLTAMGGATQGNDVWGHYDMNDGREYALMGLRNGTAIVDISTPENPRLVSHISGQATTWRDIKVLQTFSAVENRWRSYAYVTADNAAMGLQIIDLTQLPDRAVLINTDFTDLSAHNVYLSNVDYSTGIPLTGLQPYLHIAGSNHHGGAFNSYALTNPTVPTRIYHHPQNARSNYSHDVASMVVTDERKDQQCVNGVHHCEILFDFNENDIRLWDKTINTAPVELSRTTYPQASYVHSGWWSEDKLVMMVHDEWDEQQHGLNTTVRFFAISDLTQPSLLSIYTGPTPAIDHNGFVRGNRYYMSNYERGLTVLDITDPTAPKDAGFFDTYPISDLPAFNGAWGTYPFLPSGLVLISDINSGLYIVRDNTLAAPQGSFSFSAREYRSDQGTEVTIEVARLGGTSGAVSVAFETQVGSANITDFAMTSGRLHWAAGESGSRHFTLTIHDQGVDEPHESFFVRLFDPRGGATLSSPSLARVIINGLPAKGRISFADATLAVRETETGGTLSLRRTGGKEGTVTASLAVDEAAAFHLAPREVVWGDGDAAPKQVSLTPIYDASFTGDRSFTVQLVGEDLGEQAHLVVLLRDEQANQPPRFPGENRLTVNAGTAVTLAGNAEDPEGFPLTYHWSQTGGTSVTFDPAAPTLTFTAPIAAQTLNFRLTATDDFGSTAENLYTLVVQAAAPPEPSGGGKSGGFLSWSLLLLLAWNTYLRRRRPGFLDHN